MSGTILGKYFICDRRMLPGLWIADNSTVLCQAGLPGHRLMLVSYFQVNFTAKAEMGGPFSYV